MRAEVDRSSTDRRQGSEQVQSSIAWTVLGASGCLAPLQGFLKNTN